MPTKPTEDQPPPRKRGRPRVEINPGAVADAVAELLAEGGFDAVSVPDAAEKLSVSRATLYRSVPRKEDLLNVLFEQRTGEIMKSAVGAVDSLDDPGEQLEALVRFACETAIQMRQYLPVLFGGGGLSDEVYAQWHEWNMKYEEIWVRVIQANMDAGLLNAADPVIAARLILGSCVWVSRWYRPGDKYSPEEIAGSAVALVRSLQRRDGAEEPVAVTTPTKGVRTTDRRTRS